jgi:hypothetical protein
MGWRCEVCFREGQIVEGRSDGTPLGEDDRCLGCGEIICDRHAHPPQPEPHEEGWDYHAYHGEQRRRVRVTEVR